MSGDCGADRRSAEGVTWQAVSAAVAVLAVENSRSGDALAEVLGDADPVQVITALAIVAGAVLRLARPAAAGGAELGAEGAAGVIRHLGLRALEEASR